MSAVALPPPGRPASCPFSMFVCLAAVAQVIPALAGDATEQTPPDLPSYLFKERIVYVVSCLPRIAHQQVLLTSWTGMP